MDAVVLALRSHMDQGHCDASIISEVIEGMLPPGAGVKLKTLLDVPTGRTRLAATHSTTSSLLSSVWWKVFFAKPAPTFPRVQKPQPDLNNWRCVFGDTRAAGSTQHLSDTSQEIVAKGNRAHDCGCSSCRHPRCL